LGQIVAPLGRASAVTRAAEVARKKKRLRSVRVYSRDKRTYIYPTMNLKLRELSRTILKLDSGGSLESLYTNYSVCLRHLTGYLSQKDDSERKALLAVLRNIAFNKHQDLGRPVDEATIAREMKDTFRKLLFQVLEATTKGDIDTLYEAIEKGDIK
jgi:hypothetical protein